MCFFKEIQKKIIDRKQISNWKLNCEKKNQTVVFTNGCFDILHYGHINYLAAAKDLGNKLIIGLNSDDSVKRLKGEERQINDINARATMIASLSMVDVVVVFKENTPENLIKEIMPNVLVKGGDYCIADIVGADFVIENGGIVKVIPYINGFSSTSLIKKL